MYSNIDKYIDNPHIIYRVFNSCKHCRNDKSFYFNINGKSSVEHYGIILPLEYDINYCIYCYGVKKESLINIDNNGWKNIMDALYDIEYEDYNWPLGESKEITKYRNRILSYILKLQY